MRSTTPDKLQQAIALIKSGDKQNGGRLLAEILQADPQNDTAWLWMSSIVPRKERRIYCLERVLAINPDHERAKRGLLQLQPELRPPQEQDSQPEAIEVAEQQPVPTPIETPPVAPESSIPTVEPVTAKSEPKRSTSIWNLLKALAVALFAFGAFAVAAFRVFTRLLRRRSK